MDMLLKCEAAVVISLFGHARLRADSVKVVYPNFYCLYLMV